MVSIIITTMNGIEHTAQCIASVFAFTKDFELVVVDSGSTDGTVGYLQELTSKHENVKVVFNKDQKTFAEANNDGLRIADGDFVCFLNNDTIVNPGWMDRLIAHFENIPLKHLGVVGPESSMSNGKQMVGVQDPGAWHAQHRGHWMHTGVLFGWCLLVKREVIDRIGGFDERFTNSFEDNDFCLRAQLAGYKLAIAYDTYIFHAGQGTLRKTMSLDDYIKNGEANRKRFCDKHRPAEDPKLVAVYRTNGGTWLERSLEQTSKFADSIVIHFCRARRSMTPERLRLLLERFPKVVYHEFYDGVFQENYERGRLLEIALEMRAREEADWCISVDDDELYEDAFIERSRKMMRPSNPEVMGYWCQWKTIWDKREGKEYFRADDTFGQFSNYRFFRLLPNQEIMSRHVEGHHCGSAPLVPEWNLRWSKIRVKHMGYDTPEQRRRKYEFYQANDHFKNKADIGHEDYRHLIDVNVQLREYKEKNTLSLIMMIKNEEEFILGCLEHIEPVVDEMIIIDTGSTDRTKEIVSDFAKRSLVPVRMSDYPWEDNYSTPRNFAKSKASGDWCLMMDADERFNPQDLGELFRLTEMDCDGFIFHVINYLERKTNANKNPRYVSSETIRMFRNIPELYYTGVLHETLDDSIGALRIGEGVNIWRAPMMLLHYGYLKDKSKVNEKLEYYTFLNNRQIEITEGKDPRPYFNLALHYLNADKRDEAIESFHKALEINPLFWHANQQMAAINMNSAKQFLNNAIISMPSTHPFRRQAEEVLSFIDKNLFGYEKVGV